MCYSSEKVINKSVALNYRTWYARYVLTYDNDGFLLLLLWFLALFNRIFPWLCIFNCLLDAVWNLRDMWFRNKPMIEAYCLIFSRTCFPPQKCEQRKSQLIRLFDNRFRHPQFVCFTMNRRVSFYIKHKTKWNFDEPSSDLQKRRTHFDSHSIFDWFGLLK